MAPLHVAEWPSSLARTVPIVEAFVGTVRRRPSPAYKSNAPTQQREIGGLFTKWGVTMAVSNFKVEPAPYPPQPQVDPATQNTNIQVSSNKTAINKRLATDTPQSLRIQSRCQSLQVSAQTLKAERENPLPYGRHKGAATKAESTLAATARDYIPATSTVTGDVDRFVMDGPLVHSALPRSGSAPLSSNISGSSSLSIVYPIYSADRMQAPPRKQKEITCPEFEPTPTKSSQKCWGEIGDTTLAIGVVPSTRDGGAKIDINQLARSIAPESANIRPWQNLGYRKSRTDGRWKEPLPGSLLPLLSSELEASGRDTSKRKKRLLPLRRRKSDVAGGMSTQPVRARTASNGSSSSSSESVRGRRSSFAAVLQSRKARSARTSTASTECVPVSSSPSFRLGVEVVAVADPGVDQGQLKAQTRVLEWRKKQAEELKEKEGEQASFEQRLRAEAALEAARKLAAARAEEAERRHVGERDNTAELARAAELAEKWSKNSREKERRRAEIYAINAVMRAAFEKDFKAYSLEKARTVPASPPASALRIFSTQAQKSLPRDKPGLQKA